MKNTLKFYVMFTMAALVAVSCKKEKTPDITELPYAQETVEQGQANVETAGQQMVTELNTLADAQGISAADNMGYYMDSSDPFASNSQSKTVYAAVKAVSVYGASKDANGLIQLLKSELDGDTTFQEAFDANKGVYTWDITNKRWIKTTATDRIEIVFPSTKTGTSNNAKFTVTYQGKAASSVLEGFDGNLPESISVILLVDNVKVIEYSFTGRYNAQGVPSYISTFIAVYPFKFEITLNNTSSAASIRYLFTDNAKVVFDLFAGVNGNLDTNNASNDPADIIYNANAYVQVFNIKLAGRIDYKGLSAKVKEIYTNTGLTEEQRMQAQVDALNKYAALVLVYADSNQKIAQAQAYLVKNTKSYTIGNQQYAYTTYDTGFQLNFASGSPQSLDVYFGDNFTNLVNDFNALVVKLNDKFDLGAQTIK